MTRGLSAGISVKRIAEHTAMLAKLHLNTTYEARITDRDEGDIGTTRTGRS